MMDWMAISWGVLVAIGMANFVVIGMVFLRR